MSAHLPRFLNLPANSSPFALLGLAPAQCTPAQIERALRARLAQTYNHPAGRSEEAEEVRQALRDAASRLMDPIQRERLARQYHPPRIRPALTPFDREALAILVGSGGWNASSRARLVSLAQHHGVAPHGLMKVISGLSRYAREGHGHLQTADITGGEQRFHVHGTAGPTTLDTIRAVSDNIIEKYAPELREDSPLATVKLSILFGLLTIVLASFFVRMLLPESQPPTPRLTVDPALVPAEVRSADRHRARDDGEGRRDGASRTISFQHLPTFTIELPEEITEHAAKCTDVPRELEEITRRMTITDRPSERIYRFWEAAIQDTSRGWLLLERELLEQIHNIIDDVLFLAADSPAAIERMMAALSIPDRASSSGRRPSPENHRLRRDDPIAMIVGAWQIKQLVRIVQRADLPPILGDQARTALSAAGSDALPISIDRDPPKRCAAAWLDDRVPRLIEQMSYADDALLHWESWLKTQRHLLEGENFERSIMAAIHGLLASTIELKRGEPGLMLLGRLVSEVDMANSALARREMLALFERDQLSVNRLATFSAVLASNPDAPWLDESHLLPLDADEVLRRRVRHRIEQSWPTVDADDARRRGRTVTIDPADAKDWHELHEQMLREPIADDRVEQMRQLVAAARLTQAAAMLTSDDDEWLRQGRRALDDLRSQASQSSGFHGGSPADRTPTNVNPRGRGPVSPGSGVHGGSTPDGMWAAGYDAARRNHTERLSELRSLRNMGGDLGPSDAAVFVREVYRATPIDVREEAQMILTAVFPRGVNVALHMLDFLPEAPRVDLTSDLIARYTGRTLPSARSETWRREARRALIEHLITLRGSGEPEIDHLMAPLAEAGAGAARSLDPAFRGASEARTPTEAANRRFLAWRTLARAQLPSSIPVPGDLPTLNRRHSNRLHFAQSPIQTYVALTISSVELAAYVTSAEQPALSDTLNDLLRHASEARADSEELLVQAIHAERALADLWRMRIGRDHMAQPSNDRAARRDEATLASRSLPALLSLTTTGAVMTESSTRFSGEGGIERWQDRLESLDPRHPQAYFELAEDIADMAATDRQRELARHLFALAGVLSPERFARSAALALAQMEEQPPMRKRLRAMADLLDPYAGIIIADRDPTEIGNELRDRSAVLDLGEAFSALRLGRARRAETILQRHVVIELLDHIERAPAIDRLRLLEDARSGRRPTDPRSSRIDDALLIELALLTGADRPWTADLAVYANQPLIEVEDDLLHRMLGRTATRPYYRNGRWVSHPETP